MMWNGTIPSCYYSYHISQNCCHHCSFCSEGMLASVLLLSVIVVFVGGDSPVVTVVVPGRNGIPLSHSHNVTKPVAFGYNSVVPARMISSSGAIMPVEFVYGILRLRYLCQFLLAC